MSDEKKPVVLPESTEKTTEAHEAAPPDAAAPAPNGDGGDIKAAAVAVFDIPAPTKQMTHADITRRSFRLADRWNKIDRARADLIRRRDELTNEINEAIDHFAPIRAEMLVLYGVCKAHELPINEAMREMVEERTDDGNAITKPDAAAE